MKKYADYRWLDPQKHSLGRVSVFDRDIRWEGNIESSKREIYIEFVHGFAKLKFQKTHDEPVSDFVQRLGTIADVIAKFTEHLNSTETKRMRKSEVTFQHEAEVRILAPEIKEGK